MSTREIIPERQWQVILLFLSPLLLFCLMGLLGLRDSGLHDKSQARAFGRRVQLAAEELAHVLHPRRHHVHLDIASRA